MSKKSHAKHEAKHKKPAHKKPQFEKIEEDDIFTEHKTFSEIIIALVIFGLGQFFMVPVYSALTVNIQFALLVVFMLVIAGFAITHWRNRPKNTINKMPAVERAIFLTVIGLLSIAIIVQVIMRSLDIWLVAILVIIILLKMLLTSRYANKA
jgi:cation transport ATPase